jgi:hypothetical protein
MSDETYYFADEDGNRIDVGEWGLRMEDLPGRTVGEDDVQTPTGFLVKVRTLWQGIVEPSHCCHQLFGTAVAYDPKPDGKHKFSHVKGYDNKEAAELGHADVVVCLRAGKPVLMEHGRDGGHR